MTMRTTINIQEEPESTIGRKAGEFHESEHKAPAHREEAEEQHFARNPTQREEEEEREEEDTELRAGEEE